MVVGERHLHHRVDRHQVLAVLFDDDDALLDLAHPEDAHVGLRDDGTAHEVPLTAGVADGEGLVRQVVGPELALSGLGGQLVDRPGDPPDRELVGALDDRHHQPLGGVHGDAEVDVAKEHVSVVEDPRVERAKLAQRLARRRAHEGEEGEVEARLLELRLVLAAELGGRVEVALGHRHHVRCGELRVDHVVGDDPPAPAEGDHLVALGLDVRRHAEGAARSGCGALALRARLVLLGRWWRDHLVGAAARVVRAAGCRQHVVAGDAAAVAAAADASEIDALLPRELAHRRGGGRVDLGAAAVLRRLLRRAVRIVRIVRTASGGGLRVRVDLTERVTDGDQVALGHEDLRHHAVRRRGDLAVRLVGHDLDEGIVLGHALTFLHEPLADLAFRHAFAQGGHRDRRRHRPISLRSPVAGLATIPQTTGF